MIKKKVIESPLLRVLFGSSIYNIAHQIIVNPVLPLYYRGAGASMEQLALITMFQYIGYSFFEPTFGLLSDRVERKNIIAIALLANTFVVLAYTLFKDIRWFCIVAFLNSACASGFTAPSRALIADVTPKTKRGRNYGAFLTIQSLSRVFGPFIGGYLAYNYNYYFAFYASSVLMFISALTFYFIAPKEKLSKDAIKTTRQSIKNILTRRTIIFIASRALPFFFTFYVTILTIVLKESPKFQATEQTLGLIQTTVQIVSVIAQYLAGLILDKVGSVVLTIIGFAIDGVAYFGYLVAGNLSQMWLLRLLIGAINPFYNVGMMVLMMELISRDNYGFAMGLYGLSEDIGGMIGSPVLGMIYDDFGFVNATYFMVFICYLAVLLTWLNMRSHVKIASTGEIRKN